MAVSEQTIEAPPAWPEAAVLVQLAAAADVVILPDRVETIDGVTRVSFRDDAQALRVVAQEQGLNAVVALPAGAKPALYREHDASLVLSGLLGLASGITSGLATHYIQRFIDRFRATEGDTKPLPTVRYREALVDGDTVKAREIVGPADEVARLLRQRSLDAPSASEPPDHDPGP